MNRFDWRYTDIFFGGMKTENISLWDVRAKAPLYQLSTGNNQVHGMAWDDLNSTLYAATEWFNMGSRSEYRSAIIKRPSNESEDKNREEPENSDNDYYPNEERAWPSISHFDEESFGVPIDSGEHRLCESIFQIIFSSKRNKSWDGVLNLFFGYQTVTNSRKTPIRPSFPPMEMREQDSPVIPFIGDRRLT